MFSAEYANGAKGASDLTAPALQKHSHNLGARFDLFEYKRPAAVYFGETGQDHLCFESTSARWCQQCRARALPHFKVDAWP